MKKAYFLTFLLLSVFFFIQCQKEKHSKSSSSKLSKQEIIENAKQWYAKHSLLPTNNSVNAKSDHQLVVGNPDWTSAQVIGDDPFQPNMTYVPIYIDNNTGVIKYQVFISGEGFTTRSRIVEVVPQESYFTLKAFTTRFNDFTGVINIYSETGVFVSTSAYTNGMGTGGGGGGVEARTAQRQALSSLPSSSIIEGITLKEVVISAPDQSHSTYYGHFMITVEAYSVQVPSYFLIPLYPGDWGGGSGPNNPQPNQITAISNLTVNPCIKAVINQLTNAGLKNKVSSTINRIFGGKSDISLIFREKPAAAFLEGELAHINLQDTHYGGGTGPDHSKGPYQYGEIFIDINVDSVKSLPKELIATVILHEAIHAFLGQRGAPRVLLHHQTMAESFRESISEALLELFPTIPLDDRTALAWEGLIETYEWSIRKLRNAQDLNPGTAAILQIIMDYQKSIKGTPSGC